jgi:hypothetical protein
MDWNKLIFIIQSFLLASVGKEKEERKNALYVFLFYLLRIGTMAGVEIAIIIMFSNPSLLERPLMSCTFDSAYEQTEIVFWRSLRISREDTCWLIEEETIPFT